MSAFEEGSGVGSYLIGEIKYMNVQVRLRFQSAHSTSLLQLSRTAKNLHNHMLGKCPPINLHYLP